MIGIGFDHFFIHSQFNSYLSLGRILDSTNIS